MVIYIVKQHVYLGSVNNYRGRSPLDCYGDQDLLIKPKWRRRLFANIQISPAGRNTYFKPSVNKQRSPAVKMNLYRCSKND
jgi:hypothetical protein